MRKKIWKQNSMINVKTHCLLLIMMLASGVNFAADLVNVQPVTNKILLLHFDEGHIDYNGVDAVTGDYEGQTDNVVYYSPFDTAKGLDKTNYSISSANDGNYSSAKQPLYVNYKAKGTEFNGPANYPEFLREYFVYIVLSHPIVEGKKYDVSLNGLADNYETWSFTFDPKKILSPTIKINQVGFIPNQPKYAYLSQWMGTFNYGTHVNGALDLNEYSSKDFHIYNLQTGQLVQSYSNRIVLQQPKEGSDQKALGNWSKADVWSMDFSDFTTPGEYYIVVDDLGCSYPFEISDGAYWEPFYASMRGIYYQRQGIVKRADEFGNKVYPRSHHPDDGIEYYYDPTDATTDHNNTNEGEFNYTDYPVDGIWGHYYDASDWDYYVHHHRVPLTMLVLYNLKPENFADGDINNHYKFAESDPSWIGEGGNGLPDLLDEARWMVDFYKRTVDALEAAGVGTGGMSGYVGREAGNNNASWRDDRKVAVKAEIPEATYYFAASAAYFARALNVYHKDILGNTTNHPEYNLWKTEAVDAYNWADSHDGNDTSSNKEIAAAALFSITGNTSYEDDFYLCFQNDPQYNYGAWVSPTDIMYASSMYLISCADIADPTKYQDVKDFMISKANSTLDGSDTRGYRFGGIQGFWQWQEMNLYTIPRTFLTSIAYELTGDQKYLDDVYNTMSYVFGANQMGMGALSQVGDRFDRAPHSIDAWVINDYNDPVYYNPIWPGFSVYGRLTFNVNGPGSESWSRSSALPAVNNWPVGETRFESRYSISGSEYTIHQNNIWYIFGTGYLIDPAYDFSPNDRPTISINLTDGQDVQYNSDIDLTVSASQDVMKVEYFYDWHYIGTSTDKANNFKYTWRVKIPADQSYRITAKAYDNKGLINLPSEQVWKNIDVIPGSALYSINISSNNGMVSKIPNQAQYNEGVSVTLKAVRDPYYNFKNWSGDAEGVSNTVKVLVTKDMNISAVFESLGQYPVPMARWQLEDDYTDEIGDLDGIAEGNPQFVAGYEGKGVYFDKLSKINIGDGSTFSQRNEPRSVALWVKATHDDWTNSHTGDLFGYGDHHETDFLIRQQGPSFAVGTNWAEKVSFSNPWETDVWIHLIIAYDGDSMRVYKNGVPHDVAKYIPLNTKSEVNSAYIGGGAKNYWGTLDDVQFYNYALYPDEAADVFNGNIGSGGSQPGTCSATGTILMERWDGISGTAVSQLTTNLNYPDTPTSVTELTQFKIPTNIADQYGVRVRGYLCAPETGAYTFWITGDDNVELWLSTDDDPANRVKIAYHTSWSRETEWNKFSTQKSAPVSLFEGQSYYIEAFMKEHGGGDNLSVGWLKPGESGTIPSEVIPGSVLSPAGGATPPPADTQAPTVPTGLAFSNVTETSFTITWNASSDNVGVTEYIVKENGSNYNSTTGTSINISGKQCGSAYIYTVAAKDAAGNTSADSDVLNVQTTACIPVPIAHWTFENNFNDIIGTNDGVAEGTVQFVSDSKEGAYAAYFDKTCQVNIGTTPGFPTGNAGRSVCMWVKPAHDSWTGAVMADLFEYGEHHYNDFIIRQQGPSFSVGTNWGEKVGLTSNIWQTDVWMHLTVVYDGVNVITYKDGQLWDSKPLATSTNVGTSNGYIGGGLKKYWGTLDDVMFFDYALNTTEIGDLYNVNKSGTFQSNMDDHVSAEFAIYPNPAGANQSVFLKYDFTTETEIAVFNALGAKVFSLIPEEADVVEINTVNFERGIYFVVIRNGMNVVSDKLIVD